MRFVIILACMIIGHLHAQTTYSTIKQGNIWMIADSLGLNFNYTPPKPFHAPIPSPDFAIATLCDTFGRLQYFDKMQNFGNQLVMNRDSQWISSTISPLGNYQAITWFLPFTGTHITGYITFDDDLTNLNHYAMGKVIFNRLCDTMNQGKGAWYGSMNHIVSHFDSMRFWSGATVRHANGRDWWVASRRHGDDTMFVMLATPDTMTMIHRLRIGTDNCVFSLSPTSGANGGEMVFSRDGSRLLNVNGEGLIEVYDFDRCTGMLNNATQVEAPLEYRRLMYSACLSPSGQFIYTCQVDELTGTWDLVQYNLNASNPRGSKVVIHASPGLGGYKYVKLGPNNKIYVVPVCNATAGYPCIGIDSSFFSIIHMPDSGGLACQFIMNDLNMGVGITSTYPSMAPNYDLGPIDGSPCDTLNIDTRPPDPDTTVKVVQDIWPEQLKVYPNPVQEHVIIESGGVLEVNAYHLYDLQGKLLQQSVFKHPNSHVEINTLNIPPGHYVLEVLTSQGVYRRKLVKVE